MNGFLGALEHESDYFFFMEEGTVKEVMHRLCCDIRMLLFNVPLNWKTKASMAVSEMSGDEL